MKFDQSWQMEDWEIDDAKILEKNLTTTLQ